MQRDKIGAVVREGTGDCDLIMVPRAVRAVAPVFTHIGRDEVLHIPAPLNGPIIQSNPRFQRGSLLG